MRSILLAALAAYVLPVAPACAQVFTESAPANPFASGTLSMRNLALGESRFTNQELFNLYDLGGSPMGLLETHAERAGAAVGFLGSSRASEGDSLALGHHLYSLPQLSFFQPGVFGAVIYFQRESADYGRKGSDSVELGTSRFGLDLAAGPSSGLFRVGFGMHARLGGFDYPGEAERVLLDVPSLRLDLGSRLHSLVEIGLFAGFGGRFDSLDHPAGRLERVATLTLPRYGMLADLGGSEGFPARGNVVFEMGTERSFGEYRQAGGQGTVYPTLWTDYWTLQTQWMYTAAVRDFTLHPAIRFGRRSESTQGYQGIRSNQNPLKKGDKIDAMQADRGTTSFGLGGSVEFREMVQLLIEWETSGRTVEVDSALDERFHRFSLGLEHLVHRLPMAHIPERISLALRMGWSWRQDEKGLPGFRDDQFQPFLAAQTVPTRPIALGIRPDEAAGYGAFSLGFALGLFEDRLDLEGLLSFPGQLERFGATRTQQVDGTEWGAVLRYRVL